MSAFPDSVIKTGSVKLPSRIIVYGKAGCGKSSFAAYAPNPVFCMTPSEDGLLTLMDYGSIPDTVGHFPICDSWHKLRGCVKHLMQTDSGHKTFVVDTINGAEKLLHEAICQSNFRGDWDKFLSFGRGIGQSAPELADFFDDLNRLRQQRNMSIILLAHAKIKRINNPEGEDYDKYVPDIAEASSQVIMRWADCVLFLNNEKAVVKGEGNKRKAALVGRKLYTCDTAVFDAKNRFGLPAELDVPDNDPSATFRVFFESMKAARKAKVQA